MPRTLVESCLSLSVSDLKAVLSRLKGSERDFDGELAINANSIISYWLEHKDRDISLTFSLNGQEPQTVSLIDSGLTFGLRIYFACSDCGKSVFKLYQLPSGGKFKCRKCHNLRYEVSNLNRHSIQGLLGYRTNRLLKLIKSRELMTNHIIYNGTFTRRYRSFLNLSRRAGLSSTSLEANKYLSAVQELAKERQRV